MGHLARKDDGHRIVGRAEVGKEHEKADAALPGLDRRAGRKPRRQPVHTFEQPRDAPVVPHEFPKAAHQHGQDHDLVHARKAAVNVLAPAQRRVAFHACHPHRAREHDARQQNHEDVDPGKGQHQHGQIGRDPDERVVLMPHRLAGRARIP